MHPATAQKEEPTISRKVSSNIGHGGNSLIDVLKNKTFSSNIKNTHKKLNENLSKQQSIYDGVDNRSNSLIG